MIKINQFVKPDMEVARSVNLERDNGDIDIIRDYQITYKTKEILSRFSDALSGEKISAWSLTGPYGMGKSSFINYLLALTTVTEKDLAKKAWQKLEQSERDLYERMLASFKNVDGQGFWQISVTASYESVNASVLRGLQNSLKIIDLPKKRSFQTKVNRIAAMDAVDSQVLLEIIKEIINAINKPVIIVIDEFGKNLDFMSHHPQKGDIFLLQQLAELNNVYIWVCLHQAFDEYAAGLSTTQQQEWRKIQGRFEDISFVESTNQMLKMIARSVKQSDDELFNKSLTKWAEEALVSIRNTNLSHKSYFTLDLIKEIYPLHPITAISLIELCRRFAQNDRTLLSFLCSGDWGALHVFLEREIYNESDLPAVGLDYLYDYFFNINTNKLAYQAESQRWLEIHDIITEAGNVSAQESALLKTIGVLNLLSGAIGISADYEMIYTIMKYSQGHDSNMVSKWLDSLIRTKGLFYREFARELRLWEGSDFDVYGAIRTQKAKMVINSLDQLLQEYLPLRPFIASRHAFETGTVRRFERRWLSVESLNENLSPSTELDGLFLYCFGTLSKPEHIPLRCSDKRPLLVAYVSSQSTLIELALEVAAARYVFENSPELEHDRVARKEVSFRVNAAEQHFHNYISQLFSPESSDITWYANGQVININGHKGLSGTISNICDQFYYRSPIIGNEMINYNKLSSAAARARRELVEAMATNEEIDMLGLTGFGPEVAIYRSLILATGLHIKGKDGWYLTLNNDDERLSSLWEQIEKCILSVGDKGISVAEIMSILQKPPFGIRQGPAPIYICLYLLVKADDIAIFREDNYVPYLTEATIALLIKRPELFILKRFIASGIEQKVFNAYRKLINTDNLRNDLKLRNATMLGVVGPLIKYIEALPSFSRQTKEISLEAQRVRTAIMNSTEPIQLLFEEIPQAVGIGINEKHENSNWQEELQVRLRNALNELGQVYPKLINQIMQLLLEVFDYSSDIYELRTMQAQRINPLIEACSDSDLTPVLKALARPTEDISEWVKGIAGIVAKKPLDAWNDQDFLPFAAKLKDYTDRIDQLEVLSSVDANLASDTVVLSIMSSGGKLNRELFNKAQHDREIVDTKVKEILALPKNESTQIMLGLINSLVGGVSNNDKQNKA